jgi:hypothetical protein
MEGGGGAEAVSMTWAMFVMEWFGAGLVCRDIIPRVLWLVWPLGWALPGHMGQCMREDSGSDRFLALCVCCVVITVPARPMTEQ